MKWRMLQQDKREDFVIATGVRTHYIAAMPTNLYGPNDNYDLANSHVLPALMRKVREARDSGAREVVIWGSGSVRREFLHADDMASACLHLMSLSEEAIDQIATSESEAPLVNIGCGEDLTIRELAELICEVVGFRGQLVYDASKPDGTPRKLLDVSRIHALGWHSSIPLRVGIASVYEEYRTRLEQSKHPLRTV